MEFTRYASNGKANAGLGLGISGTALGVINSLGALGNCGNWLSGLFGGNRCNGGGTDALAAAAILSNANGGWYGGRCGECNENQLVNRYELGLEQQNAAKDSEIALLKANTYNDQKLLEVYKYFDGQLKDVRGELARQAVVNQKTEDSFALVAKDVRCCCDRLEVQIARERDERKCADNSIITYTNATFYPKMVADVTTGTTTTAQSTYNPLPSCGNCNCGNN